jgi:hypothetical protein
MKKLFLTLSLFFALTIGANAQDTKIDPAQAAKKEVSVLSDIVGLTDQQTTDLFRLYEQKYQLLADPKMSAERKSEMNRIVELKVQATLTQEQNKKLAEGKQRFDKIMAESANK